MKKIIAIFALFTISMQAQDIQGGFKFIANSPGFSDDVKNDAKGKLNFGIGYFENMDINENVALQGELNYNSISYEIGRTTTNYTFIDIPVLVIRKFGDFGVGFGYQYAIGWGGKEESDAGTTEIKPGNDQGMLLDLSYQFDKVNIGARYYYGSELIYGGNAVRNLSVSFGYIVF
jgi:hypothetical protein